MTDNKYSLDDLVVATLEQKPTDFEAAFNDVIIDRIRSAVEDKKIAIAQQMYNYEPENAAELESDNSEEEDYGEES
jgi:hypothetical protein